MTSNPKNNSTLHESIKTFNLDTVKRAFKNDPSSLNILDPNIGWSAVYKAVVYEQLEIAKFLLTKGADPNLPNKIGETPLHYAAEIGKEDFVRILLQYNANPNAKQSDGNTPFHIACKKDSTEIIQLMLQHQVDLNIQNKLGRTALHLVLQNNNTDLYHHLLQFGADPNIKDKLGRKALLNDNHETRRSVNIGTIRAAKQPVPSVVSISSSNRSSWRDQKSNNDDHDDKENNQNHNNQNEVPKKPTTRRKLSLGRPKDIKQRMSISSSISSISSSSEQIMNLRGGFMKNESREKILGDITNVIPLQNKHLPVLLGENLKKSDFSTSDNQTPRLLAIKSQVLKTLDIHPLTPSLSLQKSQSQHTPTNAILFEQSPCNSNSNTSNFAPTPTNKLSVKERMEALKKSCANIAKHQSRKSISEHTFTSSQNVDGDFSSEDTQSTKSYQTQEEPAVVSNPSETKFLENLQKEKAWLNSIISSNNNPEVKPSVPENDSSNLSSSSSSKDVLSSPPPQDNKQEVLITPRIVPRETLTISAGKIFNKKLINIFCPTSPTSPKREREEDIEFRRTESVYEINAAELPLDTTTHHSSNEIWMSDWLAQIGLQDLKLNFVDNGYTSFNKFKRDYEDCKVILKDLLYRFGVDKIGHRCRIVMKLREDGGQLIRRGLFRFNQVHHDCRLEYPKIKDWLDTLGYEEYLENFVDNGFDDVEYMILQTYCKEVVLDEFMMRDEIGIKNKQIRDDILKRLRHIYEVASGMEPSSYDADIFLKLLSNKDSSNKNCNIF